MESTLATALDHFIERTVELTHTVSGRPPEQRYDPEWPSPCITAADPKPDQAVSWQPVRQVPAADMFERLAAALQITLHPDIVTWYTRYWSDPLPAHHPEGDLTLLFCWNPEDMERLRGNLLGHIMAKQKQRRPLSLFFACTDGDEFMTIDNADGSIWLERPGRKPIRRLADSLHAFLADLTPRAIEDTP